MLSTREDHMASPTTVTARPQPVSFDAQRSAVIVVDMQNGFATKGGYLDRAGFDISGARSTVEKCQRVIAAARARSIPIVYLQMGWHADMHDAGRPYGGMWHKSVALRFMRQRPENRGTAIVRGTWDYAIVEELAPRANDIVIPKTRLSGFFDTGLDSVLRSLGTEMMVFTGIATNVCVEATLRDALYRDYLCLLVEDATNATGPDYVKKATLFNVETILGWVTTTDEFCNALASSSQTQTAKLHA
jgi:ureidoacrylate peracid hydrolase